MSRWAFLPGLVLAFGLPAAAEIAVEITSPPPERAIFDRVEITVEVTSTEPIESLEITVDGELAGRLRRPPYRLVVDVGPENRDRLIEVTARGRSGALGHARRRLPQVVVHDTLALELQQVYVTVTGRRGARVLDLERGDFRLLDEARPQELITFERGDVPFTAVILVDGSQSMAGQRLRASLAGAHRFASGMRRLDEAKLLVFSDRLLEITPWSSSPAPIDRALDRVAAAGGTALFDHLYMALTLLEARQGRRVVILLSDGWDIQSVLTPEQLLSTARRSQALIYWVRLAGDEPGSSRVLGAPARTPFRLLRGRPVSPWNDERSSRRLYRRVGRIVRSGGGRIVTVDGPDGIGGAFEEILTELREQYVLGYYPEPRQGDGSWREVSVELARRGLEVRAPEGYVDH